MNPARSPVHLCAALFGLLATAGCKAVTHEDKPAPGASDASPSAANAALASPGVAVAPNADGGAGGSATARLDLAAVGCPPAPGAGTSTKKSALDSGHAEARAKRWPAAAAAFCQAVALDPTDAEALGELGWAQFQAGDLAHAEASIRQAMTLPSSPHVRAALTFNLAKISVTRSDGGRLGTAISLSRLGTHDKPEEGCEVERDQSLLSCKTSPNLLIGRQSPFDEVRLLEYVHQEKGEREKLNECLSATFVVHVPGQYYIGFSPIYDSCDEATHDQSKPEVDGVTQRAVVGESTGDLVISWKSKPSFEKGGYHTDSFFVVCAKSDDDVFCSDPVRYKVDSVTGELNDVVGFELAYAFSPPGSVTFRAVDGGSPLPAEARALLGVHTFQISK